MSDFKFACPACGQRLSANDDYVGHQINCPSCQAAITVPPNPSAPPAELGPVQHRHCHSSWHAAAASPAEGRKAVRLRLE